MTTRVNVGEDQALGQTWEEEEEKIRRRTGGRVSRRLRAAKTSTRVRDFRSSQAAIVALDFCRSILKTTLNLVVVRRAEVLTGLTRGAGLSRIRTSAIQMNRPASLRSFDQPSAEESMRCPVPYTLAGRFI